MARPFSGFWLIFLIPTVGWVPALPSHFCCSSPGAWWLEHGSGISKPWFTSSPSTAASGHMTPNRFCDPSEPCLKHRISCGKHSPKYCPWHCARCMVHAWPHACGECHYTEAVIKSHPSPPPECGGCLWFAEYGPWASLTGRLAVPSALAHPVPVLALHTVRSSLPHLESPWPLTGPSSFFRSHLGHLPLRTLQSLNRMTCASSTICSTQPGPDWTLFCFISQAPAPPLS